MQVKVFEAADMSTALKLVKESLGPDALVLSTRTIKKGGLGLLGKSTLEVTAAIESSDFDPEPATARGPYNMAAKGQDLNYEEIWRKRRVIEPLEEEVQELKGQLANIDVEALRQEICELKSMMKSRVAPVVMEKSVSKDTGSPLTRMISELTLRGVEPEVADQVVRQALRHKAAEKSKVKIRDFLMAAISGAVNCSGSFFGSPGKARKIALLGPTGVGKTTTVAKLTADYLLNKGRSVALVTIDIYRIAAAEQLKVYGDIMNVPVDVAGSPQEFRQIMQRHQDKELVLIDTAGRSPRDREGVRELLSFVGPESGVENHLVLSAATREKENYSAIKRFSEVPLQSLIMTKLDECESLGSLLNVHLRHGKPLSYLTDGQQVPEDLMLAESGQVGQLVLGKLKNR